MSVCVSICWTACTVFTMWDYAHKCALILKPQCKMCLPSLNHSFLHSVYCADVTQRSRHIPAHFYSAIYSRRANQKLWTSSRETRPKHPEEPFCLTFIHSCSFSRVPPESIWQTLVKKRLWGKKNNKSFLNHPHPICCGIIFFYYLHIMCADMISAVWSGSHCGCSCVFFLFCLWSTVIWDREGGKILPRVHLIVHSGPS